MIVPFHSLLVYRNDYDHKTHMKKIVILGPRPGDRVKYASLHKNTFFNSSNLQNMLCPFCHQKVPKSAGADYKYQFSISDFQFSMNFIIFNIHLVNENLSNENYLQNCKIVILKISLLPQAPVFLTLFLNS